MSLKRIMMFTAPAFAVVIMSGCANKTVSPAAENNGDSRISAAAGCLVDLPTSIADTVTGISATHGSPAYDPAIGSYNLVRMQTWFVDQLVCKGEISAKKVIKSFAINLPWTYIKTNGSFTYGAPNGDSAIGYYNADSTLKYTAIFKSANGTVVSAAFNGDSTSPSGWVKYFLPTTDSPLKTDSLKMQIGFNKVGDKSTVNVTISQNILALADSTTAMTFKYTITKLGDIINISAATYFPKWKLTGETVGRLYEYTAVVNDAPGVNQAKVNLGLPSDTVNSVDTSVIFGTYGVESVWGNAFIAAIKVNPNDTLKGLIVKSYTNKISVDSLFARAIAGDTTVVPSILASSSGISNMTIPDLNTFCQLNKNSTNPETARNLNSIIWILKLAQPVYFCEAGTGHPFYAGNANSLPSGFDNTIAEPFSIDPINPSSMPSLLAY